VDEIRCGNFVYYDLTQVEIGSCHKDDIAVTLACPIVATHLDRSEIVIYGGAVHLSKDSLTKSGQTIYGEIVQFTKNGWEPIEGAFLKKISQEHGIVHVTPKTSSEILTIGNVIGVLPVHSCLVADMMTAQQTLSGDQIRKMIKI
jgi:D-serine deaminase-like pyridoxal phosphate-dependent protein